MSRQPLMRYERQVLACGVTLAMIHIVDFAFVHRGPGGLSDFAAAALTSVLLVGGYPWLPVRWRAAVAGLCGAYVSVQGLFGHVLHIIAGTASDADYTGVLYLAGGLIILGLAALLTVRNPDRKADCADPLGCHNGTPGGQGQPAEEEDL